MHRLLHIELHLPTVVLLILAVTVGGASLGMWYAHETVYDYTVVLAAGEDEPVEMQYGVWPALADRDFFTSVREQFMQEGADFVEANLTTMMLRVYTDGAEVLAVPIKSKGKEGSWWETPSGLYRAEAKKDTHFSSFGRVYTPWNIPFQGNFFIHGWPYYPDGTPVPEGYSGGCIRLGDEDARTVYDLVEVGMPILVFEEEHRADDFTYLLEAPDVRAQSYLVVDLETNFVLLASGTDTPHDTTVVPAMMAALVASEHRNIEKEITVPGHVFAGSVSSRLTANGTYSIYDLFFPLLLEGSDAAARAIAYSFGEARFVELLEEKAEAIGMEDTSFTSVAGEGNETTAEDVFLLLKYLRTNRPFVLALSAGTANTSAYGAPAFSDISSTHPFFGTDGFIGGGASLQSPEFVARQSTPAAVGLLFASSSARTTDGTAVGDLVTVLSVPFGDTTRPIALIVLDSSDPETDTHTLLSYAQRMFE